MLKMLDNFERSWLLKSLTQDQDDYMVSVIDFATKAHEGQVRKYNGEPYITHPISVTKTLIENASEFSFEEVYTMMVASILHDTVEDTDVTLKDIEENFGSEVAVLVDELTNRRIEGNRAFRKAADRDSLAKVSKAAKAIKIADLIDNSKSIVEKDQNFAKVFVPEKEALLEVIGDGDAALAAIAHKQIVDAKKKLGLK